MRQYDRVFTISENEEREFSAWRNHAVEITDYAFHLEEHPQSIVVTIQDLQDLWNAGRASGRDDLLIEQGTPVIGISVPDFSQYLKEQGITTI